MAAPSGSKKGAGWKSKERGTADLDFSVTVWNDESTPRFSIPIIDPNYKMGWMPQMDHIQAHPHMQTIRNRKNLWFMKPLTMTTQLLLNLFLMKQKLPLVSLELWKAKDVTLALRFENVVIDDMQRFEIPKVTDDLSDIYHDVYHAVSMKAESADWYSWAGHQRHHLDIQRWRDS